MELLASHIRPPGSPESSFCNGEFANHGDSVTVGGKNVDTALRRAKCHRSASSIRLAKLRLLSNWVWEVAKELGPLLISQTLLAGSFTYLVCRAEYWAGYKKAPLTGGGSLLVASAAVTTDLARYHDPIEEGEGEPPWTSIEAATDFLPLLF